MAWTTSPSWNPSPWPLSIYCIPLPSASSLSSHWWPEALLVLVSREQHPIKLVGSAGWVTCHVLSVGKPRFSPQGLLAVWRNFSSFISKRKKQWRWLWLCYWTESPNSPHFSSLLPLNPSLPPFAFHPEETSASSAPLRMRLGIPEACACGEERCHGWCPCWFALEIACSCLLWF